MRQTKLQEVEGSGRNKSVIVQKDLCRIAAVYRIKNVDGKL